MALAFESDYSKSSRTWQNNTSPSLNQTNLNAIEALLAKYDEKLLTLDVLKLDARLAEMLYLKDVDFNIETGSYIFTRGDGTQFPVNTGMGSNFKQVLYEYMRIAQDSAVAAKESADIAHGIVDNHSFAFMDISSNGHLMVTVAEEGNVDFEMKNGRLEVIFDD